MPPSNREPSISLINKLLEMAKHSGAVEADVFYVDDLSLTASCRLGKTETIERSEGKEIGLRLLIGQKQAIVSTSDMTNAAFKELVERAKSMALAVPEDPYCGLLEPQLLSNNWPNLDLADPEEPKVELLIDWAQRAENAAREVPSVTNSEGGEASWNNTYFAFATTNGFLGHYDRSRFTCSVSVLAGEDVNMERDYDWSSTCFMEDLICPETIGRRAGEGAVKRLKPRKATSGKVPVVYHPRVSGGIIRHFCDAISGSAITRGTSYLKNKLNKNVFAKGITITDDPHRKRGLRSRPFDAEGAPTKPLEIINDGRLSTWLLDTRAARQLGMSSTGHAVRSTSSLPTPSPSNLYLHAGNSSPSQLISDIQSGLYITELIGMGVNSVTGDYSRGAAGFWIDKGEIAWPVSELTVAGNLNDMLANLIPANDLLYQFGIDAPTIRIDGMTVAGQ